MKTTTLLLLLGVLALAGTHTAQAQASIEIGPRGGVDIDLIEEPFVGADLRITMLTFPITINPVFDYYFTEGDGNLFQVSGNALYKFGFDNQVFTPYSGLGVGVARFSNGTSTTDVGLNIVGGAEFSLGALKPFVQAQVTLLGDTDFATLGGGLLFRLGS
ncbi:MAG: hypothetical protein R3247_00250 [Rhodothermales bacterium]|nr:hypothetical protein [Rhodothermales bacterium]